MPGFNESSITLEFPDANFFRFSTCNGYKALSGNNFKEMDACWYDSTRNLYWIIELKDFTSATLSSPQNVEDRAWNLLKKAVDSFCMFLSSKHGYPYGMRINQCLPATPDTATEFKFITVVHCKASQAADIQLIHNSFRRKFRPYAELFGISNYAVIEHSTARRLIPHNIIQ